MLKWLMRRWIRGFERQWHYNASYLREMLEASPQAAWRFAQATRLGQYRRDLPRDAWFVVGLTTVRQEDCGPCTQLSVSMAERAGVSPQVLRAVLRDDPTSMPADVALVWRFTRATLARDAAADECRKEMTRRWGPRAVVSAACAMAAARLYPTIKYAMGHGETCVRVVVGGDPVVVARETARITDVPAPPITHAS